MRKGYKEKGEAIAKMLGWFQEEGHKDTWFVIDDNVQYVSYCQYKDPYNELPFHKDWNYLMQARFKLIELTGVKIDDNARRYYGSTDIIDYEININYGDSNDGWINYETIGDMTPIELMFEVVAEISEEYLEGKLLKKDGE